MGRLIYGSAAEELQVDDRTLAHLRAVIVSKWRRGETFLFTLPGPDGQRGQGPALWMHPRVPLRFTFSSNSNHALNRRWLDELLLSADSVAGLRVLSEPVDD
ncbi:hypothetical protein [Naasia aerilata]|uniref:DUF7882 domain-containing protein n=1 Tax=Naasia aerilata TaxID=1162966 RepID=A0ABM8GGJ3_9MICO|nr:hypothetical protein [Naasia aerilata]BDZ47463.1 hypothetical protein GCM10025866_33720 [Naasia aerilata]